MGRTLWWLLTLAFSRSGATRNPRRPRRPFPVRVVSVQDGDSLVVIPSGVSRTGNELRVRLYAIDAPEMDQEYGREARDYLGRLVRGRSDLMLEPVDTDRYGRLVGVLYYRDVGRRDSVNRLIVRQGLGRWYSRYGGSGLGLERAEEEARRGRRGIWDSTAPVAPWDHRRNRRKRAERARLAKLLLTATVISVVAIVAIYLLPQLL